MVETNLVFCTLFDSNYIDKGLALYESLLANTEHFRLYIFTFDQLSYDILVDLKLINVIAIPLSDFETQELLNVKNERSQAEYCWTSTPITIEHVMTKYNEKICTYIDADIYFHNNPNVLFDEFIHSGNNSVVITEHRYSEDYYEKGVKESGKYCVQFNTFVNDENGLNTLRWWKEQTLEWCSYTKKGEKKGDQKYLESFSSLFDGVYELKHLGGGVAPWNIKQYELVDKNQMVLRYKGINFPVVFYHYQNIRYLPFGFVNIKSQTKDKSLKYALYYPYLQHIEKIRQLLKTKYSLNFSIKKGYYKNPILQFIQSYIMPFKISVFSDIISLRKVRKLK